MSTDRIIDGLMEELASIEHDRWSRWQRHVHARAIRNPDGSLTLPADMVARWERQIAAPYDALSEPEKEQDREQVRSYLPVFRRAFGG